jgi:cell division protein FtsN
VARRGKSQARRQGSNGTPVWAWLLIGLFVGALAYFGVQQYLAYKSPTNDASPTPQLGAEQSSAEKPTEPPASGMDNGVLETDYSFYDVLPTQETVDVDVAPESVAKNTDTTTDNPVNTSEKKPAEVIEPTKTVASDNARYMLQAGAFERNADAENLKARIALSGEPAHVEEAEVNGKTMYRVRLGPYENADAASSAQSALANQGINANRIRIK